jgi:hypothetical protein
MDGLSSGECQMPRRAEREVRLRQGDADAPGGLRYGRVSHWCFAAGTRESVPPEGVWSGLEGLFTELTETLDAIRVALPAAGLNAEVSALDRRRR